MTKNKDETIEAALNAREGCTRATWTPAKDDKEAKAQDNIIKMLKDWGRDDAEWYYEYYVNGVILPFPTRKNADAD